MKARPEQRRNEAEHAAPGTPGSTATLTATSARPALYSSRREALRAANREEQKVSLGDLARREPRPDHLPGLRRRGVASPQAPRGHDPRRVQLIPEQAVLPRLRQAALNKVSPSVVQDWVTKAHAEGLSPRSIKKYHVFLSSIFRRAVRDRILVFNPCDHTELPKVILRKSRTVTPEEFERLVAHCPRSIGCWSRRSSRPECGGAKSSRCGHDISTSSAHGQCRGHHRRDVQEELPYR